MNSNFTAQEILEMIAEVGHQLQLCDRQITQAAHPEYGIPEQSGLVCRPVRGYVVPKKVMNFETGGQDVASGSYYVYISPEDFSREDLKPESVLIWQELTYQLSYKEGVHDQGTIMLHKLELMQTQSQTPANQPDRIY